MFRCFNFREFSCHTKVKCQLKCVPLEHTLKVLKVYRYIESCNLLQVQSLKGYIYIYIVANIINCI